MIVERWKCVNQVSHDTAAWGACPHHHPSGDNGSWVRRCWLARPLRRSRHAVAQPVDDKVEHFADAVAPLGTTGKVPNAIDDAQYVSGIDVRAQGAVGGARVEEQAE